MKRWILNLIAIFVLFLVLSFGFIGIFNTKASATGGTCCDQAGATCYMNLDGVIIIQPNAYYSPSSCQKQ